MRHSRRMVAPINSIKHFVSRTNTTVATGAVSVLDIVDAVAQPAVSNTTDVVEGSIVKAVWIEYWAQANGATGTTTQVVLTVEKIPSNGINPTVSNLLNLMAYQNKKNILFTHQGVQHAAIDGVSPIPILRAWVLIPKGKQRMGLGDRIVVSVTPLGTDIQTCGMFIFKEYK